MEPIDAEQPGPSWAPPAASTTPPPATPFAPPTFDAATPPPLVPVTSVVLTEPPRRRRTGLWVGLAALAVVALGVGGFFAFASRDDDDASSEATFSLDEVPAAAEDQGAFTATISAMDQTIEQHAEYDLDAGLMSLTMTLPGFFDDSMEVSAIVDLENEVIYLDASLFEEMGLEVDTTWLRIDREALEEAGQDASGFDQFKTGDPTGLAGALVDIGEVTEIGKETIDGEELMHYQVVADTADLLDADPEALEQLEVQVEQFGGELPDEVVYDVWVTEDNRVRRMVIDLEMGVMQASVEYVFEDLDGPVEIELPADDDVTDIMDLV